MIRMGTSSVSGRRRGRCRREHGARRDVRNERTGPGAWCAFGERSATEPDERAVVMEPGCIRYTCGSVCPYGVMSRCESRKFESEHNELGFP